MLFRPLVAQEVADAALYMLSAPSNVSVKALDVVPSGEFAIRSWL